MKKWYFDTYITEQLKTLEESLKAREATLKQAVKEGRIFKEDIAYSAVEPEEGMMSEGVNLGGRRAPRDRPTIKRRLQLKRKRLEDEFGEGGTEQIENLYAAWVKEHKR